MQFNDSGYGNMPDAWFQKKSKSLNTWLNVGYAVRIGYLDKNYFINGSNPVQTISYAHPRTCLLDLLTGS